MTTRACVFVAVLAAACAGGLLTAGEAPPAPIHLLLGGLTADTIEPCGCGGQYAGGLARRAAEVRLVRAQYPELLHLDAGSFAVVPTKLPLVFRSLAVMGVDGSALAADDLAMYEAVSATAAEHALPITSLAPPPTGAAPPVSLVIGPTRGARVGVVSVAFTVLSIHDLIKQTKAELDWLRAEERVAFCVLVSHLGATSTRQLVQSMAAESRPELVAMATQANEAEPAYEQDGCLWVNLARRGRGLALVSAAATEGRYALQVATRTLFKGDEDPTIAGWVDEYFDQMRRGELAHGVPAHRPSFPPVSACAECHEAAVAAWRRHPHAHAVETLEAIGRDVSSCLLCHSEALRRDGVRPSAGGDRGVVCATCHRGLTSHMAQPTRAKATTMPRDECRGCHTEENSQHFDAEAYWNNVHGACLGTPQARVHPVAP